MNWKALENSKCPSCANVYLTRAPFSSTADYYCGNCPFRISAAKFDSIVNDLYKPKKFRSEEEKLGDLNNLGRDKVSEDFSDSHYLD